MPNHPPGTFCPNCQTYHAAPQFCPVRMQMGWATPPPLAPTAVAPEWMRLGRLPTPGPAAPNAMHRPMGYRSETSPPVVARSSDGDRIPRPPATTAPANRFVRHALLEQRQAPLEQRLTQSLRTTVTERQRPEAAPSLSSTPTAPPATSMTNLEDRGFVYSRHDPGLGSNFVSWSAWPTDYPYETQLWGGRDGMGMWSTGRLI